MSGTKFTISMQNFFRPLMKNQNAYTTIIKSDYYRNVCELNVEKVRLQNYEIACVLFTSSYPQKQLEWTFAKGLKFSALVNYEAGEKRKALFALEKDPQIQKLLTEMSLDKVFAHLPKLPSTYLLVMQVVDIFTLEMYAAFFHTSGIREQGSSFTYHKADEFSNKTFHIAFGQLDNGSMFDNGDLFFRYLGDIITDGKNCSLYDYYAEESSIRTAFKKSMGFVESKSFFSGKILIDLEEEDIIYGDLIENIIPYNNGKGIFKRRIVELSKWE